MRLSLPFVPGVDESVADNPIQRIAVDALELDGTGGFTRERVKGWLFQPSNRGDSVLIVPPKTKIEGIPATHSHVLTGTVRCADTRDHLSTATRRAPLETGYNLRQAINYPLELPDRPVPWPYLALYAR